MEKVSPDTSSVGQQAKTKTLSPQQSDVFPTLLVRTPVFSLANQGLLETTTSQEKTPAGFTDPETLLPRRQQISLIHEVTARLNARQSWEGTVLSCDKDSFQGIVHDRTNGSNPDEIVTFQFDEISEHDRALVAPGASFYWTIGTERSPAGQLTNIDLVIFRRLPPWKSKSLREADEEAEKASWFLL